MRGMFRASVVALVVLTACGATSHQIATPPSPPTDALTAWKDFPVHLAPRPIVWLRTPGPVNGFVDGNSKVAGFCYKFLLADGLVLSATAPPAATATWPSGNNAEFPAISAAEAFAAMLRTPTGMSTSNCNSVAALLVTSARLGSAGIGTDRGTAQVSAWIFTATGVRGDLVYPALAPIAYWGKGMSSPSNTGATASADGLVLEYRFGGTPDTSGPCGGDYTAAAAESDTAVAIAVKLTPHDGSGSAICPAIAQMRTVTVRLGAPLGDRVLVDEEGRVVEVCAKGAC